HAGPATLPSPTASSRGCPSFAPEPVDIGIEHATAIALSVTETRAISDGNVVCVHRAAGAKPIVRATGVVRAAASPSRICAQHTSGSFECFGDGERPYDFGYFERQLVRSPETGAARESARRDDRARDRRSDAAGRRKKAASSASDASRCPHSEVTR